jgi:hypothetical protein
MGVKGESVAPVASRVFAEGHQHEGEERLRVPLVVEEDVSTTLGFLGRAELPREFIDGVYQRLDGAVRVVAGDVVVEPLPSRSMTFDSGE